MIKSLFNGDHLSVCRCIYCCLVHDRYRPDRVPEKTEDPDKQKRTRNPQGDHQKSWKVSEKDNKKDKNQDRDEHNAVTFPVDAKIHDQFNMIAR